MHVGNRFHLTYCTNIHPGESWEEVQRNLRHYLPSIRRPLAADRPFAVGLRLSARAAQALEVPETLSNFQEFLKRNHLYLFTINGFPYGAFHHTRVKEGVYLPDWTNPERLEYSKRLARILAALLPEGDTLPGSISTVPGAFKPRVRSEREVRSMTRLMLGQALFLDRLREETGKTVTLALEPEPCCFLETVEESIRFFRDYLFNPCALEGLSERPGEAAAAVTRRHLGICYDACHMAVEFEEPGEALHKLQTAGIPICKFHLSSALRLQFRSGDGRPQRALGPFAESTYLHQVVEKSPRGLRRYVDLPEALAQEARAAAGQERGEEKEWRVHFHVPIFLCRTDTLETTQDHLVSLLQLLGQDGASPYLEVETYTWEVLPPEYRTLTVGEAVVRELSWVRDRLVP